MKTKKLAILTCIMLVLVVGVGATLAWLTDKTDEVKNTFTVGDVEISLDEVIVVDGVVDANEQRTTSGNTYKLIPGYKYVKDPTVTVAAGSEDCYLFVKFEEKNNVARDDVKYILFESALTAQNSGWTKLTGNNAPENVWYRVVYKNASDAQDFELIVGNEITINPAITKTDMKTLKDNGESNYPELKFTAYAIQHNVTNGTPFDPMEAWTEVSK